MEKGMKHYEVIEGAFAKRTIGQETFIVPLRGDLQDLEKLFLLNATAAFMLNSIVPQKSLNDLASLVSDSFDVAVETSQKDVEEYVGKLEALGVVRCIE